MTKIISTHILKIYETLMSIPLGYIAYYHHGYD